MSKKMRNLQDLLQEQLQDLYSAETQIIDALPKMQKKASHSSLKSAIEAHLSETERQKERLEKVADILNFKIKGEKCKAIEGIIKEAEHFMKEDANADVIDAGIIANAQRVEHYEIAGYGTVITYAKKLGYSDVVRLLEETLNEEKETDGKLTELAVESINEEALAH